MMNFYAVCMKGIWQACLLENQVLLVAFPVLFCDQLAARDVKQMCVC